MISNKSLYKLYSWADIPTLTRYPDGKPTYDHIEISEGLFLYLIPKLQKLGYQIDIALFGYSLDCQIAILAPTEDTLILEEIKGKDVLDTLLKVILKVVIKIKEKESKLCQ